MNNRGMTTIELITSFVLASVVFVILFNLVLSLKDIYMDSGLKTKLLIEQANLSRSINKEINSSKTITNVKSGRFDGKLVEDDTKYYTFMFNDGTSKLLSISQDKISFDGYVYELTDGIKTEDLSYDNVLVKPLTSCYLLVIDIPISSDLLSGDYGVKVIYRYDPSLVTIEL